MTTDPGTFLVLCSFRKYLYFRYGRFYVLHPPPPRNFSLASYIAYIILAFHIPFPLGISNDLPWGGCMDFFWNYTLGQKIKNQNDRVQLVRKNWYCLRDHNEFGISFKISDCHFHVGGQPPHPPNQSSTTKNYYSGTRHNRVLMDS